MRVRGYLAAIPATARKFHEDREFRDYVRDALMSIASNTATYVFPGGVVVEYGYKMSESRSDQPVAEPEDDRPCREVVDDMWARIRGEKV